MGSSMEAQKYAYSKYVRNVKAMCRIGIERTFSILKSNNYLYCLHPDFYQEKRTISELHKVTNSIIESRRSKLGSGRISNIETDYNLKNKLTFLDILLQSSVDGQPLTKEDIREEVDTFMFEVKIIIKRYCSIFLSTNSLNKCKYRKVHFYIRKFNTFFDINREIKNSYR